MALPLPYHIKDPTQGEDIQGNFDALAKQFPISRKDIKVETPHVVGGSGEPAFQNSWVNYDTSTFRGARFWKDAMGLVHLEGLVKNGAAAPSTIFTLPAGYRPGNALIAVTVANSVAVSRVDIAATGNVVWQGGGTNAYLSLFIAPFKQEA